MGITHYMQKVDREYAIQVDVWEGQIHDNGLYCSKFVYCSSDRDGDEGALEEHLEKLVQLEEDQFVTGFHQRVEKDRQKAWHDRQIKNNHFKQGDLVLLYDTKFMKDLGKLQMHWLGPYVINFITKGSVVQLQQLSGVILPKLVNGSQLNPYIEGPVQHVS